MNYIIYNRSIYKLVYIPFFMIYGNYVPGDEYVECRDTRLKELDDTFDTNGKFTKGEWDEYRRLKGSEK